MRVRVREIGGRHAGQGEGGGGAAKAMRRFVVALFICYWTCTGESSGGDSAKEAKLRLLLEPPCASAGAESSAGRDQARVESARLANTEEAQPKPKSE